MKHALKNQPLALAVLVMLCGLHHRGEAAITCSVSATNINTNYIPTNATATLVTGSYTVNCLRNTGDPATIAYDLAANSGLSPTGSTNRVRLGATTYYNSYEIYRSSTIMGINRWQIANSRRFAGTVTFIGSATNATSGAQTFWLNIPAPQTEDPAGTYTDTVAMTLAEDVAGSPVLNTGSFDVNITTVKRCVFTTTPAALTFNYTSFQATTSSAGPSAFQVRCTRDATYSVALDATSGSPLGLTYNLTLTSPANLVGNSGNQNFSVSGTMGPGQSGTCNAANCTATQLRALTITY